MLKHNKRYIYFLLATITIIFIFNCKKDPLTKEYFPTKTSDQWKYKTSEPAAYFIREFSGSTRINGTTFLNWIKTDFDTAGTQIFRETSYVIVTDTTVEIYEYPDSDPYILLKLPLEVDSIWSFEIDEEPINALVEGKENDYSVEAGSYDDVYVVRYDDSENEEIRRVYFAPNVGIIKDIWLDYEEFEPFLDEELVEYPVK